MGAERSGAASERRLCSTLPGPAMDYAGLAEAAAGKMGLYRRDPGGWRGCRRTSEVSVSWRPSAEFAGNLYRGEGILPASPHDVWECIKPVAGGPRTKWDQNVKDFEVVEAVSDTVSICRTTTPSAFMRIISPREFVDVVLMKQFEDGTMLSAATNVEHPLCPPQPNFVRGFNYPCGCFCIPLPGEPDKTQLLSFFQTDLGGYLPQTVVDSFFPASIAGFYSNLTKAVKKNTTPEAGRILEAALVAACREKAHVLDLFSATLRQCL